MQKRHEELSAVLSDQLRDAAAAAAEPSSEPRRKKQRGAAKEAGATVSHLLDVAEHALLGAVQRDRSPSGCEIHIPYAWGDA